MWRLWPVTSEARIVWRRHQRCRTEECCAYREVISLDVSHPSLLVVQCYGNALIVTQKTSRWGILWCSRSMGWDRLSHKRTWYLLHPARQPRGSSYWRPKYARVRENRFNVQKLLAWGVSPKTRLPNLTNTRDGRNRVIWPRDTDRYEQIRRQHGRINSRRRRTTERWFVVESKKVTILCRFGHNDARHMKK